MRYLSDLKGEVQSWRELERRVAEVLDIAQMAIDEEDASLADEIGAELEAISSQLEELEFELTLGGEYDQRNAILAVHAGAGGTDA